MPFFHIIAVHTLGLDAVLLRLRVFVGSERGPRKVERDQEAKHQGPDQVVFLDVEIRLWTRQTRVAIPERIAGRQPPQFKTILRDGIRDHDRFRGLSGVGRDQGNGLHGIDVPITAAVDGKEPHLQSIQGPDIAEHRMQAVGQKRGDADDNLSCLNGVKLRQLPYINAAPGRPVC